MSVTPSPPGADHPTLIVVEDEEVVSLFLSESLAEAGFAVRPFSNAESALDALEHEQVAGAIIDIGLPRLSGDALARRCRESRPSLPIILATGYDEQRVADEFGSDPLTRVLGKPFDIPRLLIRLEELGVRAH